MGNKRVTRGRTSSVEQLPKKFLDAINKKLKQGYSQAAILKHINALLKESDIDTKLSRSSFNRYTTKFATVNKKLIESRQIATMWADKFGDAPTSDLTRYIIEMLRTTIFEFTLDNDGKTDENGDPKINTDSINNIALAVQRLEKASEISDKRERQIRQEAAKEAAKKVEVEAKKQGISNATVEMLREAIYNA